jgi:signal transduction histidine kinase
MGRLLGLVVERFELQRALAESVESEQRRIAEELHDGLGQELTAISLMAKGLYRTLEAEKSPAAERAKELAEAVPGIVRQTRSVIRGLMPVELDSAGLMSALQQAADATEQRYGISCRLDATQPVGVNDSTLAHHLYRIAQEALNNCVKHAGADLITIRLNEDPDEIRLEIEDNGRGLHDRDDRDGDPLARGMGLRIMRHRANLIHGALSVERVAGGGTIVTCRVGREGGTSGW